MPIKPTGQIKKELDRPAILKNFAKAINDLLEEKKAFYGYKNSFLESNSVGQYTHALGEAKYKLDEFIQTAKIRALVKAATWIYLIFETEANK
jgi:hypothetical protein